MLVVPAKKPVCAVEVFNGDDSGGGRCEQLRIVSDKFDHRVQPDKGLDLACLHQVVGSNWVLGGDVRQEERVAREGKKLCGDNIPLGLPFFGRHPVVRKSGLAQGDVLLENGVIGGLFNERPEREGVWQI